MLSAFLTGFAITSAAQAINPLFALTAVHSTSPVHQRGINLGSNSRICLGTDTLTNYTIDGSHLYADGVAITLDNAYLTASADGSPDSPWSLDDKVLKFNGSSAFSVCYGDSGEIVFAPEGQAPASCHDPITIVMFAYIFNSNH